MERKPQPSFDRFSEKPARGRFSSGDRFADRGERRPRFGGDDRFADRGSRFDSDRGERRFDRNDRFGGERREGGFGGNRFGGERREGGFGGNRFGGERRFGGDRPAFRRFDRNEPRFAARPARRLWKPVALPIARHLCRRRPCVWTRMWRLTSLIPQR